MVPMNQKTRLTMMRVWAAGSALLLISSTAAYAAEQVQTPDAPPVDARAWILMDYASGKVLAEGNADEKLDPASLTKLMTSYVVGAGAESAENPSD
ncbi:D-alanyl-D-alanine carboxypeptidase [Atlantibacter hermannii]|nr:D-alanyl-D-alanine carboxypeptidase [Atlantibacter hermannii]